MKKAIDLSVHLHIGSDPSAAEHVGPALVAAFAAANPGLQLTVNSLATPNAQGDSTARVRIAGEQEPAADFAHLAGDALHRAVAGLNMPAAPNSPAAVGRTKVAIHQVAEDNGDSADDENTGVVLPPGHTIAGEQAAIAARAAAAASGDHATPAPAADDPAAAPSHDPATILAAVTPAQAVPTAPALPTSLAPSLTKPPSKPDTATPDHPAVAPASLSHPPTATTDHLATAPTAPAPSAIALPTPPAATGARRRAKGHKGGGPHRHSG
ncbi:MAG: hypothetical protein M3Z04_15375 [Chloroflexota bacterium]|nr:hypothetical protein [Chloroflexota bacterium]